MIEVLVITILLLGLAIAGIAIKMFLKKDGEFQKVCGSVDPDTGQRLDLILSSKKLPLIRAIGFYWLIFSLIEGEAQVLKVPSTSE